MIKQWRKKWVQLRSNRVYNACLSADGETAEGVHWRDQSSQITRFRELIKVIKPDKNLRLTDWGCGYGALFDYISDKEWMNSAQYTGIDINEKMIRACQRRIVDSRATFQIKSQPITRCDYLVASGTWNFKMHESQSFWWSHIKTEISQAWHLVNRGMAFNLLSIAPRSKSLFWMDADRVSKFIATEISENAIIQPISGLPDISVVIWK